jgi:hypothetical protein
MAGRYASAAAQPIRILLRAGIKFFIISSVVNSSLEKTSPHSVTQEY